MIIVLSFLLAPTLGRCTEVELTDCIGVTNIKSHQQEAWWVQKSIFKEELKHKQLISEFTKSKRILLKGDNAFVSNGHILLKGQGDALIYRNFFKGWPWATDTSDLLVMTIVFPSALAGEGKLFIDQNSDIKIFYTVRTGLRDYCFGYATQGRIYYKVIENNSNNKDIFFSKLGIENGVWVTISAIFDLFDLEGSDEGCGRCVFSGGLVFKPQTISFINELINTQ